MTHPPDHEGRDEPAASPRAIVAAQREAFLRGAAVAQDALLGGYTVDEWAKRLYPLPPREEVNVQRNSIGEEWQYVAGILRHRPVKALWNNVCPVAEMDRLAIASVLTNPTRMVDNE